MHMTLGSPLALAKYVRQRGVTDHEGFRERGRALLDNTACLQNGR